jgi:hypothetical protein
MNEVCLRSLSSSICLLDGYGLVYLGGFVVKSSYCGFVLRGGIPS